MYRYKDFTKEVKKIIFLSTIGSMIEFYDFIIFALFSQVMARKFFPNSDPLLSLLASFGTFSIGYLSRPLGGLIYSHIGDRFGRKKPFSFSILLMGITTFFIGCMPTYQQIGVFASIGLVVLRLLQGFSVGGEIPGSITYISEIEPKRRYFACGLVFNGNTYGVVFGFIFHACMSYILTPEMLENWGWRICFWFGGIVGFVSFLIRKGCVESPVFEKEEREICSYPVLSVVKNAPGSIFFGSFLLGSAAILNTFLFVFLPVYLTNIMKRNIAFIHFKISVALLFSCFLSLVIIKHINPHKVAILIKCFLISALILVFPIYLLYENSKGVFFPLLLSVLITGPISILVPSVLSGMFKAKYRYTGVAVCYNSGITFFGGLVPVVMLELFRLTEIVIIPAYMIFAVLTIVLLLFNKYDIEKYEV